MVENKKTKRERDIKAKLMAAIAMLLVSSIMMVSTTYAWFTLSTAPEVTGITTSIASNGNLEIALSPLSGNGAEVGDATIATGNDWGQKNRTWGNLLDMGYAGNTYGLADLTLAPAQLALEGTEGAYKLGTNVLATPEYGADGRISDLNVDASIAGKPQGATGYSSTNADFGVRAVGKASGMSAQEAKFKASVGAISTYASAAVSAASNSLAANGDALAGMLVAHAAVQSGEDTNEYKTYAPALKALTDDLVAAAANIEGALRASLAAAASNITDESKFNAAIDAIEGKTEAGAYVNTLDTLVGEATKLGFTVPSQFEDILDDYKEVAAKIATAASAAAALETSAADGANWSEVSPVLNSLMNIGGDIKISGQDIDAIKQAVNEMNMEYLLGLATDCQIELGAGSGVYYDLALITGNITAKVPEVHVSLKYGTMNFNTPLKNVIIKTVVPANTSKLPVMKTTMAANPPQIQGSTSVLDSFYGYVIDLMVRTNAEGSNLKLQSAPAQRVYNDSTSEATQGQGATISFKTQKLAQVGTLTNLIKSINVVFFDPTHDNAVFGMAKVTNVMTTEAVVATNEAGDVIEYTITGTLEMCQIKAVDGATGLFVAGNVKTDENASYLCALTQNVPQAISAMVYLDGEKVTSADVLADAAVTGILNLQFASSAELKPMENSDLRNMTVPAEGGN